MSQDLLLVRPACWTLDHWCLAQYMLMNFHEIWKIVDIKSQRWFTSCSVFSESCYTYSAKLISDDQQIETERSKNKIINKMGIAFYRKHVLKSVVYVCIKLVLHCIWLQFTVTKRTSWSRCFSVTMTPRASIVSSWCPSPRSGTTFTFCGRLAAPWGLWEAGPCSTSLLLSPTFTFPPTWWCVHNRFPPVVCTRSGVLRTQKLRTPLVGAKGYQRFPLFKLGVGI